MKLFKNYVLGFYFSTDYKQIVLIKRLKNDWQFGCFNGLGGSINEGESSYDAMVREFKEEANVDTIWNYFAKMKGGNWEVDCYVGVGDLSNIKTGVIEEGEVMIINVEDIYNDSIPVLPNLKWLVPLALDGSVAHSIFTYLNLL